jgi:AcrR family transcriptional regulator
MMKKLRRCCEWKKSSVGRIERDIPDDSRTGTSVQFEVLTFILEYAIFLYMNINLENNLISLGEALTHFNAITSGEGGGLRLPLREKKFARVRLVILSAVLQLTKERSLAEISVREICEVAQVAPATFFNYFPSKEDVLVYYMRLWSIPVTLQCRAVAAQRTVLDAIITVFDFTAREMEQYPRLMFEVIAYIAHATEPPHPPSLTRAERLLAFPDLPGAEDVEPQTIDELFTTQLKQAVRAGELPSSLSTEAVALLLKTIFYGVPLATRREGVHTVRITYHEVLDVLLAGLKQEEKSKTHGEGTKNKTGTA